MPALIERYGAERVIATDIRTLPDRGMDDSPVPCLHLDCTKPAEILEIVRRYNVGTIFHLAAMLSAAAEHTPQVAWKLNMDSLYDVLEVARHYECAVFFPSSIGAFGPDTPKDDTPQDTIQRPTTIYGVTKVAGELLCDYYASRYGVDTRGLRLPGLISHSAMPGGGTTDYAVEIFHQAIRYGHYSCFLRADTRLDMMYMPDAIAGMIELMAADTDRLRHRNAFNVTAMSITPEELAEEIRRHIPEFRIDYEVDPVRQKIADSWPRALDDSAAREEWDWAPEYDLPAMVMDMIGHLETQLDTTTA